MQLHLHLKVANSMCLELDCSYKCAIINVQYVNILWTLGLSGLGTQAHVHG